MKKYIFLTFAISGIGGTQIYVRNKIIFMQKQGWDVLVISTEPGDDICVKELQPYRDYIMPELMQNPFLYSKCQRLNMLYKMMTFVGGNCENIIIESNFMQISLWGELLAKKMEAKHFVYLIQEDYKMISRKYLDFFNFKYERGELAGNTKYALKQLFKGYRHIPKDKTGELTAVCYNTIEECESTFDEYIEKVDFHIGSIGRVNKPFVNQMVEDLIEFSKLHKGDTFQLVMFGGSPDKKDLEEIYFKVKDIENLSVFITGPIFPIPKTILDKMDAFISSAGAARTSSDAGYITITIDANDFEPIGILGYTTNDNVHRNPEIPHKTTINLLDEILYKKKFQKITPDVKMSSADFMEVFKTHLAYIQESKREKVYYNIKLLSPKKINIIGYRIFGKEKFTRVYKTLVKMKPLFQKG